MKVLGNSLHLANSGKLIARSSQTPIAGAFVFNSNKKKIGKVNSVFGPTKNPYISINLFRNTDLNQIKRNQGEKLYVSTSNNKKKKRRGRKTRTKI